MKSYWLKIVIKYVFNIAFSYKQIILTCNIKVIFICIMSYSANMQYV